MKSLWLGLGREGVINVCVGGEGGNVKSVDNIAVGDNQKLPFDNDMTGKVKNFFLTFH